MERFYLQKGTDISETNWNGYYSYIYIYIFTYRHIYTCITHINVHTHTTENGKRSHHIVAEKERRKQWQEENIGQSRRLGIISKMSFLFEEIKNAVWKENITHKIQKHVCN